MKLLISFISFLMLFSCNPSPKPEDKLFEINPLEFSEEQFTLSDIATDILYIPLDNSFPLGRVHTIRMNREYIYVSFVELGIVKFDKNGKFIKIIARRGKGPGEYIRSSDFVIDEQNNKLYNLDNQKITIYSLDGDFLGDFSTKKYFISSARNIEMFGSNIWLSDFGSPSEFKYNWIVVDSVGELVSWKKCYDHPGKFVDPRNTIKYKDEVFYYNRVNDTIFIISPDFKERAAYLFAQGNFRYPKDGIENSLIIKLAPNHFNPYRLVESKYFTIIEYCYKDKNAYLLIDKKTHKTFQAYKKEQLSFVNYQPSIRNDIDGGLPIEEILYSNDDNPELYLKCVVNPVELKAYVASEAFKTSTPKYPEKKKALEKLANNLDENGNPVLMLVKLKE